MSSTGPGVNWQRVAEDFEVNQNLLWLNSCGIAPMPTPVHQAVAAHLVDYSRNVILGATSDSDLLHRIQHHLAPLIGASAANVAPIHHTTEGMTFVSLGLNLQPGDRIVLMANEYPSNVYPWEHWSAKGVELATLADGPTPAAVLESARELLTANTKVLTVSAVHWCTGMPLPLRELGELCEQRGVMFVVDGAQGVGHVDIDVVAQKIDVLAFSAWKWLLGPLGLGALYMSPMALRTLAFPFKGTGSVVNDHQYLPYRNDIKTGAERYVVSTQSFTDWVHFDASLAYLSKLGFANVQARISQLAAYLTQSLRNLGFETAADGFAPARSSIVVVRHPRFTATQLVDALAQKKIVAAERMGWLRLAPHIHLTETHLDAATEALRQVLAQTGA